MDEAGITVQDLSNSGPGPISCLAERRCDGREMNDDLRQPSLGIPTVSGLRCAADAAPDDCADELVRAVKDLCFVGVLINGTTEAAPRSPSYDGLLAAAVELTCRSILIHTSTRARAAGR